MDVDLVGDSFLSHLTDADLELPPLEFLDEYEEEDTSCLGNESASKALAGYVREPATREVRGSTWEVLVDVDDKRNELFHLGEGEYDKIEEKLLECYKDDPYFVENLKTSDLEFKVFYDKFNSWIKFDKSEAISKDVHLQVHFVPNPEKQLDQKNEASRIENENGVERENGSCDKKSDSQDSGASVLQIALCNPNPSSEEHGGISKPKWRERKFRKRSARYSSDDSSSEESNKKKRKSRKHYKHDCSDDHSSDRSRSVELKKRKHKSRKRSKYDCSDDHSSERSRSVEPNKRKRKSRKHSKRDSSDYSSGERGKSAARNKRKLRSHNYSKRDHSNDGSSEERSRTSESSKRKHWSLKLYKQDCSDYSSDERNDRKLKRKDYSDNSSDEWNKSAVRRKRKHRSQKHSKRECSNDCSSKERSSSIEPNTRKHTSLQRSKRDCSDYSSDERSMHTDRNKRKPRSLKRSRRNNSDYYSSEERSRSPDRSERERRSYNRSKRDYSDDYSTEERNEWKSRLYSHSKKGYSDDYISGQQWKANKPIEKKLKSPEYFKRDCEDRSGDSQVTIYSPDCGSERFKNFTKPNVTKYHETRSVYKKTYSANGELQEECAVTSSICSQAGFSAAGCDTNSYVGTEALKNYTPEQLHYLALSMKNKNPISSVYELCQKMGWNSPIFTPVEEDVRVPSFRMQVLIEGEVFVPMISAPKKKEAKVDAANCVLRTFKLLL